jgi:cytochrome oxidase assembly protein ShyY1
MNKSDSYRHPGSGLLVLLLVVMFVTCALGIWQIRRGQVKQHAMALFDQASRDPPIPWQQAMQQLSHSWHGVAYKNIVACGVYDEAHQFLLEGRGNDTGEPQYEVWTPLHITSGYLIVSRGLIQHDKHAAIHVPSTYRCITGLLRPWPRGGLRLGPGILDQATWPKVAVFPTPEEVHQALGRPVFDVVVMLHPKEPDGFVRQWRMDGFGPARHFGYALTWFALAACSLVAAVWLALQKRGGHR